jgi:hypothetical protein
MTEEGSVKLLLHKPSFSDVERVEAAKIVFNLGYLALALDQAASYISSRGLPLKNFMSEYNARKKKVLQEIPAHWEYRKRSDSSEVEQALSVFTTWEMSQGMIGGTEKENRAKHRFLTLAAFFDNKRISERYFSEILRSNECPVDGSSENRGEVGLLQAGRIACRVWESLTSTNTESASERVTILYSSTHRRLDEASQEAG